MAQPRTQPGERRSFNPKDQFGRKWCMTIEVRTGDPTGQVLPAGWSDPLRTPMHYVRVPKDESGNVMFGTCAVDYEAWIREVEHEEEGWFRRLVENATIKNIEPLEIEHLLKHKVLLQLTGPKPWPSSEVLKLAAAGDKGFLGLTEFTARERAALHQPTLADLKSGNLTSPPRAENKELPPDDYREFIGYAMRNGAKNLTEVGKLWKEHKSNLQAA